MKQKYINANIYRHDKATEFIVENGRFSAIGTDLGHADEIIDVKGKLI
ncbi:cytosine deaminase, partial [Enterococcus faecalis]|nr:cytosine deaminase [Enterococcus faecalis]EGO2732865.1 cytosine deaminase [Enterococcus faecalis]EGO7854705.1 cytosine deaminase [Enterococcus faecalis]EGO8162956.1 cytosine deaminase [Enterococcus faecalis]EGO8232394.1 cytosine deaminase [Enterococcus faecalis]